MYCAHCGSRLSPVSKFCGKCGCKVKNRIVNPFYDVEKKNIQERICIKCGGTSLKMMPGGEYVCEFCGAKYDTEESRERNLNKPTAAEMVNLFLLAEKYESKEDYEGELKLLVEYRERCWDNPRYLIMLGYAYRKMHFYEEAIECYKRAMECDPEDLVIAHNLAVDYLMLHEPQKAALLWDDAIRKMDNYRGKFTINLYAKALANYGACLMALGNKRLGEQYLERSKRMGYKRCKELRDFVKEEYELLEN